MIKPMFKKGFSSFVNCEYIRHQIDYEHLANKLRYVTEGLEHLKGL